MAAAVADVLVVSGPVEKNKSAMLVDGGTDEEALPSVCHYRRERQQSIYRNTETSDAGTVNQYIYTRKITVPYPPPTTILVYFLSMFYYR